MKRVGVFVCHCGVNIAGVVDIGRVLRELSDRSAVACAIDYQYMCSDPGQSLLVDAIRRERLDAVVVASCSPAMHEATFRKAAARAGLNPYCCEIANIREQDAWVHQGDRVAATQKAIEIVRSTVAKVLLDEPLVPLTVPVIKRALIVGGGLAGLTAALDVADAGYSVTLVEREAELGGNVGRLSGLYLTFAGADSVLHQRIEAVLAHPGIAVRLRSRVKAMGGYLGNFTATLDTPAGEESVDVGAVVLATGLSLYPKARLGEYGAGQSADVIDGLEFERMMRAGPIARPSDGRPARTVVWVQCAGSRDPELHRPYCSKICCMYVAKQAAAFRRQNPDGQAFVFYIDIRSTGKGYEEFVQAAMEEGALYIRGKASRVFEEDGRLAVWGVDTLSGRQVQIHADLVVLATAALPAEGTEELARLTRVATDESGFFAEAHPKLRPVESLTAGVFLAGAAQFPKDIPETVAQASGAAAKVLALFAQRELVQEPTVARIEEELCAGCGACVPACPYDARALDDRRPVALVNAALCQGCGACGVACPNKATTVRNWTAEQVLDALEEFL